MDLDAICENSFRNFHAKGFDYLCLTRTPELTRKVYFFEGEVSQLPEIVMPHDHRYAFTTTVLAGKIANVIYVANPRGDMFQRFSYRTPLNGGDGFTWQEEQRLLRLGDTVYGRHQHYHSTSRDIHTLSMKTDQTVIMLEQMADDIPLDVPTTAWCKDGGKQPPSLDGLYDRMTPDHAIMRLEQFFDLVGNR